MSPFISLVKINKNQPPAD